MKTIYFLLLVITLSVPALALNYEQDITPDVIFGSGNDNGQFTVDIQDHGTYVIELGLRGKLRYNDSGLPENTFNSIGGGSYVFENVSAFGQPSTTPVWNFEFAVNVDQSDLGNVNLDDFTFELGLDFDPDLTGTTYLIYDPIIPGFFTPWFDHAIGNNGSTSTTAHYATDGPTYTSLLSMYYVAQNSYNYEFFNVVPPFSDFDPTDLGVYQIYLKAFKDDSEVASTNISIVISENPVATDHVNWSQVKSLYR